MGIITMPAPAPHPEAAPRAPAPGAPPWQVRLLGGVEARRGALTLSRWPSRATALLLARLALAPDKAHAREELIELLWPGVELDVGRNRLRQVLSTLKALLEPGSDAAPVISANRSTIALLPGSVVCDAVAFEQQARHGTRHQAQALYRGELMPGHYDEWVLEARNRLAVLNERLEALPLAPPPAAPLPSAAALAAAANPLPAGWTRLFGIESRTRELGERVRTDRLVTVVGPGGCGKTRLAIETARLLRDTGTERRPGEPGWGPGFAPDFVRVAFVSLVECEDEAQAVEALARALGSTGRDPLQRVHTALAGSPVLLVLDNFEQLVVHAAGFAGRLLEALPALHLLITSRLRLGLPGEQVFVLGGLPLPAPDASAQDAGDSAAVALFVDRARAARGDFELDARQLPAVRALVRLLDGMPLALELAASRVRSLSPEQMLQMLGRGDGAHLALLARSGPRAGHDPRHASIAQVIAWSWRLLAADEQHLLAALACWTGDAGITGLAAMLKWDEATLAARLDDLVGHSLVQGGSGTGTPRYGLVEPVREFVRAQWPAAAWLDLQQTLLHTLLPWALALPPAVAATAVDAELPTVHTLLASAGLDTEARLQLALALRSHWERAGLPMGVQDALAQAVGSVSGAAPVRPGDGRLALACATHELLAYARFEAGDAQAALGHADTALALAAEGGALRSRALVRRAWVELAAGRSDDDDAPRTTRLQGWLHEALALARAAADRDAEARALHQMAVLASHLQDDWAGAEVLLAQSQALWQALGDTRKAQARLRNRGQCWLRLGRLDDAQRCFEQCERAAREDGDWVGQIDSLLSLSSLLNQRRQWQASLAIDRRCIALCWQRGHRHGLAYALWNPPHALARLRQPGVAMRLMAFAATFWETHFGPLARADRHTVRRVQRLVRAQLGSTAAQALWTEGAALDITDAVDLALQAGAAAPPPR